MPIGYTEILCITIYIEELYIFAINFIIMGMICFSKALVNFIFITWPNFELIVDYFG